jgi:hypothetical protein
MFRSAIAIVIGLSSVAAMAQMTPVGLWKTIDDHDASVKSEIRIVENGGVVSGKVERPSRMTSVSNARTSARTSPSWAWKSCVV